MSSPGKSTERERESRGWREGRRVVTANGYRVSFWGDEMF
jgi:hypothetical protein